MFEGRKNVSTTGPFFRSLGCFPWYRTAPTNLLTHILKNKRKHLLYIPQKRTSGMWMLWMHILNLYLVSNFNPSQNYKSIGDHRPKFTCQSRQNKTTNQTPSCIFLDEYSTITRHGRFFEMQQMSLGFYGCDLGSGPPKSCDPFVLVVSAMFKNKDFSLEIPQFAMGNRHWNNRCISWYIIELSHIFQNHVKWEKRFYQWWLLPGRSQRLSVKVYGQHPGRFWNDGCWLAVPDTFQNHQLTPKSGYKNTVIIV